MIAFAASVAIALQGAGGQAQPFDTTFAVGRGERLEASVFSGSITVKGWTRDQMRIQAAGLDEPGQAGRGHAGGLDLSRGGGTVRVHVQPGRGSGEGDLTIWVPAATPLDLDGNETTITVDGVQGSVRANTIEGDVSLTGGGEFVELASVDGSITASGVRGRLQVSSVDGDVVVRDVRGAVTVTAVDGSIELVDVDGPSVLASSVDGDVSVRGPVRAGGTYRLTTHDGDVTAALGGGPDAEVSVSTFSGDFESTIPVTITQSAKAGRQFSFTLGRGGAQVHLETFDGTIRLQRTGP